MALIEFQNIKKSFGKKEVLSDISFDIKEGEIFGLVGRSGCGKSTLLKILIGMVRVNNGKILFEGESASKKLNYLRKNTGFATQENMLFEELSIEENSLYFGKLYGIKKRDIKERFKELINLLSLEGFESTQVSNLSGGMKKRANFLVSLIHNPKLLVLDEPTVGLDPLLRQILWEYIKRINKIGTTILVTSHLLDEIEDNCDRVGIIEKGKIIALTTVEKYREVYGGNRSLSLAFENLLRK